MNSNQTGSIGVANLVILLFLAASCAGAAGVVGAALSYQARSERAEDLRAELLNAVDIAVDALRADSSPEADGPDDPIRSLDGAMKNGVRLKIRDASSAVNPNFTRKNPLEKTELSRMLTSARTPDELQQHREDAGLSPFPGAYAGFFTDEALDSQVAGFGWANINTIDEFALRTLVRELTGSDAIAESVRQKARSLLTDNRVLSTEELPAFLGADFSAVFPFVNAEPSMNVNFVDPAILRALLGYETYAVPNPVAVADAILSARMRGELKPPDLKAITGLPDNHIILHYFGCRTWFWELSAEKNGLRCVQVLARVPDALTLSGERPGFVVVDTRFIR